MSQFYDFELAAIDGSAHLLAPLKGRVTLAVNVASHCGLTPQYAELEALYQELNDEGFAVLGLPCNQFGAQEPGTPAEIVSFCQSRYGVSFPLSEKIEVNGPGRHPLYAWLTSPVNGHPGDIQWNFEKFLIARDGRLLERFSPTTKPRDHGLAMAIAEALERTV